MSDDMPTETQSRGCLERLVGRSLPSRKYGAWIVAEVRGNIEGRSRLVTGNLKGEQWVWTRQLVAMLEELDSPNGELTDAGPVTPASRETRSRHSVQ